MTSRLLGMEIAFTSGSGNISNIILYYIIYIPNINPSWQVGPTCQRLPVPAATYLPCFSPVRLPHPSRLRVLVDLCRIWAAGSASAASVAGEAGTPAPLRCSLSWTSPSRAPAAASRRRAAPPRPPRALRWAAAVGCSRTWLSTSGRRSAGMRGQWLSAERRASSGKPSFQQGNEGKLGEAELRAGVGGGCELVEEGRHRRRTPGRGAAHRRLRRREQGDVLLCCTAAALQGRRQDRTR
jgi:hypothetical protein